MRRYRYPGFRFANAFCFFVAMISAMPVQALDPGKELNRYSRQTVGIESGLPQNTVRAIAQTHDGYIWLGTEAGLVRFDGLKFVVYDSQNTPQLKSDHIRSLFEDRDHALWIGTPAGLTRLQHSTFQTFTTERGLPSNNVLSTYQDRSGTIWAVSSAGIAKYKDHSFEPYPVPEGTSLTTEGVIEDPGGSLWVGTQDGLRVFSGGNFARPPARTSLPNGSIQALLVDNSGRVWIASTTGLTLCTDKTFLGCTASVPLPSRRVVSLYQDRSGSIWIGTDAGLVRLVNNNPQQFPTNDPLSSTTALAIFEDREGSVWIGTDADGLTVLHDEKFTTYTGKDGLSDDFIRCVFQDRNGTIWAGTNNGGLGKFDRNRFSALTTNDGLSSNVILSLADDRAGNLLVGTPDGLNVIGKTHVKVFTSADGLADDFVRSLYTDTDGSIWIGTRRGLSHWTGAKFKTFTQADGLGSDFVGTILRDHAGNLWVATLGGLTRFQDGSFTNFTRRDGLSSNVITALYEDQEGVLWIGTQDGGLNRLDGVKFSVYPATLGLPGAIYGILEDASGNLWLSSKRGIFRVSRQDLNAFAKGHRTAVDVALYGAADGLKVNECTEGGHPSAWKSSDGALWFATLKGVTTANPREFQQNRLPPPVALESVSLDNETLPPARAAVIPPGHSRIAFEYTGLSFLAPRFIRFRYKLDGFDRDWIDAGTRRVAYYTNVPPGKYRFLVTARNHDGPWNEAGAVLAFELQPRFYQTYWFDLLIIAGVLLLAYEIYRWRVRQVQAQFAAVLAERSRIAREIHDTLAQGFVAVSVHLELVARAFTISADAGRKALKQVQTMVQDSLAEARRSIWELRSHTSDDDLASKLSALASRVSSTTQTKAEFQVFGTRRPLPPKIERELLKIGQEAISNVIRHSAATNVRLELSYEPTKVRLVVSDDGRGFANEANAFGPDGHFGLKGMRERAEHIDAELRVKSAPGEGTEILVETEIH